MNRNYLVLFVVIIIYMLGCRTIKSEENYYLRHFNRIAKKYNWQVVSTKKDSLLNGKLPTRKNTKDFLAFVEHNMALFPDSMELGSSNIEKCSSGVMNKNLNVFSINLTSPDTDSLYYLPAKINYIRRHNIVSPNIKFIKVPKKLIGTGR